MPLTSLFQFLLKNKISEFKCTIIGIRVTGQKHRVCTLQKKPKYLFLRKYNTALMSDLRSLDPSFF